MPRVLRYQVDHVLGRVSEHFTPLRVVFEAALAGTREEIRAKVLKELGLDTVKGRAGQLVQELVRLNRQYKAVTGADLVHGRYTTEGPEFLKVRESVGGSVRQEINTRISETPVGRRLAALQALESGVRDSVILHNTKDLAMLLEDLPEQLTEFKEAADEIRFANKQLKGETDE